MMFRIYLIAFLKEKISTCLSDAFLNGTVMIKQLVINTSIYLILEILLNIVEQNIANPKGQNEIKKLVKQH